MRWRRSRVRLVYQFPAPSSNPSSNRRSRYRCGGAHHTQKRLLKVESSASDKWMLLRFSIQEPQSRVSENAFHAFFLSSDLGLSHKSHMSIIILVRPRLSYPDQTALFRASTVFGASSRRSSPCSRSHDCRTSRSTVNRAVPKSWGR